MPAAGDPINASDYTALANAANLKPIVKLAQTVAQTGIAHNTGVAVTFTGAETYDAFGYHDPATNTSRVTPLKAGWYRFDGVVSFQSRTDWTLLYVYFRLNGVTLYEPAGRLSFATAVTGALSFHVPAHALIPLNGSTDYVELVMHGVNTAAVTYATIVGGIQVSALEAEYVRDL